MVKQLKQFPMGEKRKMKMKMKMEDEEEENPNSEILPDDVIIDAVLPRLPVKSLLRFSSVCKLWFNSINNDSNFISYHFLHQSQKKPTLIFLFKNNMVGGKPPCVLAMNSTIHLFSLNHNKDDSGLINHDLAKLTTFATSSTRHLIGFCNGLICLRKGSTLEVCNPSRREVLSITSPQNHILRNTSGIGFGFDTLTNEYKVVSIRKDLKCIIFTLGGSSWREISGPNIVPRQEIRQIYLPTLCNGVLYWRTVLLPPEIVSFDLHSEEFQVISIPFDYHFNDSYYHVEYKGSLCFARLEECQDNCIAQLKILKDRTNQVWVEENICFPFRYPSFPLRHTIRFMSFSDQFLVCWFESREVGFRLYNLHSENVMEVNYPGCWRDYLLTSHVENFLSLRTLMQHSGSFCRIMSLSAYFDDQDHIFKV